MIDFDKSKRFRRLCIGWAIVYVTTFTTWTFISPPTVTGGLATLMASIIGVVGTMVGLYQYNRSQDDRIQQIYNLDPNGDFIDPVSSLHYSAAVKQGAKGRTCKTRRSSKHSNSDESGDEENYNESYI